MEYKIPIISPSDEFLKKFIDVYVSESLTIGSNQISLAEFDRTVRGNVSKNLNVPLELILALHHSFHWVFFTQNDSLFYFKQPMYRGEQITVMLKRKCEQKEIDFYRDLIWKTYGDYMRVRIMNFSNERLNNSRQ